MNYDDDNFLGLDKTQSPPPDPTHTEAPSQYKPRGVIYGAIGVIAVLGIFIAVLFIPHSLRSEAVQFEVEKGETLKTVTADLKTHGLIRSSVLFEVAARISGISKSIQSGTYQLSTDMSIFDILRTFISQPSPNELIITIPEGWTVHDIAMYFENKGLFKAKDFLTAADKDYSGDFPFLQASGEKRSGYSRLEGYLFPDTYRVFKDATPDDIIRMMLKNFDTKLSKQLRDEITIQRKSIGDITIMASLIEREVRSSEDKAIVSGILWKRLKLGIALQVDASIVYLKTDGYSRTAVDKVYLDDLKIDSPYNTYKYRGLPPAPISNPGLESIEAAIYPKTSPYLYYLSAPDGTTIFSKTLDEHNTAKAKNTL